MRNPDPLKRERPRHSAPLPEVHRARQQPRLLHGGAARVDQHEPAAVPRVVPADHVQPPPDGSDRHGPVRAAVPRSVQLRLSPADRHRPRPRRRGDAQPFRRGEQAGRDDAARRELLHVVERRAAHHGLLPQHDRPAHRDHRQSDADGGCVRARPPDHERRPAVPDRAAEVALPPVDRVLDHGEPRGARRGVAQSREVPLQHLPDGQGLDREGVEGHLDDVPAAAAGGEGRDRAAAQRRRRRRRCRGWCRAASPQHRAAATVRLADEASPSGAIRGATCCPPTRRTS